MKNKIILNGQEFEIIECSDVSHSGNRGELYHYSNKIKIAPDLEGLERLGTIWHEIIHKIMVISGAEHIIKADKHEYICDLMGYGIASVMLQNPDLMKLVDDKEKS
jgi:hypothetical protein